MSFGRVDHRPWPLPDRPWIMAQSWHDLLFAHYAVDAQSLAGAIPPGLDLDLWEGRAWCALVPFRMSGIRLRATPALPWLSAFTELNVRTYVVRDGKPGVWFFSLDAANPVAVTAARVLFHLPYFRAHMSCVARPADRSGFGEGIRYRSSRTHRGAPPAEFRADYEPIGPVFEAQQGTFEHWCAERYCLYVANSSGRIYRGEIHHAPWPLQPAQARLDGTSLLASAGLTPTESSPRLLFARRIDARIFALERLT